MIDITNLSMEELVELRTKVNGRIASLKALEKRKGKGADRRNRKYLFSTEDDAYKFAGIYANDGVYCFGKGNTEVLSFDYGYWCIHMSNTKEVHSEILASFETERLYYHTDGPTNHLVRDTYVIKKWKGKTL